MDKFQENTINTINSTIKIFRLECMQLRQEKSDPNDQIQESEINKI